MSTTEYGDVLFIPSTLTLDQYPNFFAPLGTQDDMSKQYMFTEKYTVDGQTYAIPTGLNAQGFVYNAAVFKEAGITSLPTTPDEFIADLKLINENTDAIPLYTNYAADWPITNWSQLLLAMAGDTDYYNKRIYDTNAYAEGSPLYETYNMLYQAVSQGLVETDPITSDWATSQQMLADGKVGILTIASWGVSQEQALTETPEDIKLMPAPMQYDGKFNLEVAPDYAIAVNKNSENVEASKEFVTWFVDRFVVDGGFVSPKVDAPTPDYMSEIPDVNLVQANPTSADDAAYQAKIEGDSGLGIYDPTWIKPIIELGIGSKKGTFDEYMNGLNEKWNEAMNENK